MFLNKLNTGAAVLNLYEKKEELIESANERKRVNKLFFNYTKLSGEYINPLYDACLQLISRHNSKPPQSAAEGLYEVRCLLVHRCYTLTSEEDALLENVNDAFVSAIIQMLITFRRPCLSV